MDTERTAAIRSRLEEIAEELDDIGQACLREAISQQSAPAAADERLIARARRAVLKAAGLLGGADSDQQGD